MTARRRWTSALAVGLALSVVTGAARAAELKTSTFGGLVARPIGPAVTSGRIADLVATATDPSTVWVGAASGGLWRSRDSGITFTPVFDQQPVQSIGSIALDPKDPQTIWVGTGEPWTRNSTSVGAGVFRSTDGGDSWESLGLADTERIDRVIVDPKDSKVVWVCAVGHLWNANPERGVFKTIDGGKSWQKVLFVDDDTGCGDLSVDPGDSRIAYAGMWQFRRYPWAFESGGKGSGLFRTMDGGKTWTRLANGMPKGNLGRIAVAVAPSRTSVVYATIEAKEKTALYRSDDLGEHWQELASSLNISVRPFYFSRLVVDPTDWQRVYKPGLTLSLSRDGGKSFTSPFSGNGFGIHGDLHALWIDPRNSFRLILGTDGGVYESLDRGGHWRHFGTLPVSQVYRVAYDMARPYDVYVGLQDNGSWMGPSSAEGGVRNKDWRNIGFGDGFWAFPDSKDDDTVYSEMQGGGLFRFSRKTGEIKQIAPFPEGNEPKLRFNWNTAYTGGPSGAIYVGAQYLFRSQDHGESWQRISPDLTTNDPNKQKQDESGGLTVDNSSAENHTTIYAIAESPKNPNLIWVGSDDGNLQVTRDGGKSWTNVVGKVPGVPKNTWVSNVEASPFEEGTAFVTFDGHRTGDRKTYLYETTDFGQTWKALGGEGVDGYAHVIRQDPTRADLLYLGTEFGLWVSIDGGAHFARFEGGGLPRVPVMDLKIHPRDGDLIIGTHGRGVWIVDDLSPLRALTPAVMDADFTLLPAEDGVEWMSGSLQDFPGDEEFQAGSPPEAAAIFYYLKKRHVMGEFKVEVFDAQGKKITTLPAGGRVGINMVPWPMRLEAPQVPAGNEIAQAVVGPYVPEGTYTFKITKGDKVYEGKVKLVADPRSPYPAEDRALEQKTALTVYHDLEDLTYVTESVVDLQQQAQARAQSAGAGSALGKKLTAFDGQLEALRRQLTSSTSTAISGQEKLREHMSSLYGALTGYLGRPTASQLARVPALEKELAARQADFVKLTGAPLGELNHALAGSKLGPLTPLTREAWDAKKKKEKGGAGSTLAEWPVLPIVVR